MFLWLVRLTPVAVIPRQSDAWSVIASLSVLDVETGERQDKAWAVPAGVLAHLVDR